MSSVEEFDDDAKFVVNRPCKQIILMAKYTGMGHYVVLCVLNEEFDDDQDKKIFFVERLGGSNGYDQEDSFNTFNALKCDDIKDKLKSFVDAVRELAAVEY